MKNSSQLSDNSSFSYPKVIITPQENNQNERKSYLPVINKLELVIHRGQLYVKSASDSHQLLRIVIFSLMYQALTSPSVLIENIKRILSKHTLSVEGKVKQNKLWKMIEEIPINAGTQTEQSLINLFVDSTDTEIVHLFQQAISTQEQHSSQLQQYTKWLKQKFGKELKVVKIDQKPKGHQELETGQLFLFQKDGIYLKSSCQTANQLDWPNQEAFATPVSSAANSVSGRNIEQCVLDLSLTKNHQRASGVVQNNNSEDSIDQPIIQLIPISTRMSNVSRQSTKNQESKSFSLWEYFCC